MPEMTKTNLPPLPDINSEHVRLQVFTHRSFYARQTHMFEDLPDDPSLDNEMLEHLGDSVLGLIVTDLLRELYPYLRVGAFAKIRALVVGNTNLASISLHYRLPDRLRMHPAQVIPLKASMHIQADIFEAYVGGLYLDQGLDAVKAWLRPLLQPYLLESYQVVRAEYGLPPLQEQQKLIPFANISPNTAINLSRGGWSSNPPPKFSTTIGHLALFNQHLQQESKPIEWVYSDSTGEGTKTTPVWVSILNVVPAPRANFSAGCASDG